ncbi:hypothetical protein H920_06146 [Fukomys damarensis]|uniref:Uncharacterized protein n=1 Tax=Fukomys damarensis TaxID=885580 RepID=A0A091DMX3_FUKDA|nr:hypothetical protein H920_06146 [Fukomys damarensis]
MGRDTSLRCSPEILISGSLHFWKWDEGFNSCIPDPGRPQEPQLNVKGQLALEGPHWQTEESDPEQQMLRREAQRLLSDELSAETKNPIPGSAVMAPTRGHRICKQGDSKADSVANGGRAGVAMEALAMRSRSSEMETVLLSLCPPAGTSTWSTWLQSPPLCVCVQWLSGHGCRETVQTALCHAGQQIAGPAFIPGGRKEELLEATRMLGAANQELDIGEKNFTDSESGDRAGHSKSPDAQRI